MTTSAVPEYVDDDLITASPGDLAIAARLCRLSGETDPAVELALTLAVRWARAGSTCIDLADAVDLGLTDLDPRAWLAQVAASPLVTNGVLSVDHGLLHLGRYHDLEVALCQALTHRAGPAAVDEPRLDRDLDEQFPGPAFAEQRAAAEQCVRHQVAVLTGGPGTGKTTTVSRLLTVLDGQADALLHRPLRAALAAPTGKAAARLRESLAGRSDLPEATTLHGLLGIRPRSDRATYGPHNRLPHDVVIVDETSMASLPLIAALLDALRPGARLLLIGDPDQLASVEAGAVLRDIVDGWAGRPEVAQLTTGHRQLAGAEHVVRLAEAIRAGDADAALAVMTLVDPSDAEDHLRATLLPTARDIVGFAEAGDLTEALARIDEHRLLCGRRSGPRGASTWNDRIERWLREERLAAPGPWFPGRAVLVSGNDRQLGVFNGDTGVCVPGPAGRPAVAIAGTPPRLVAAARLPGVLSAWALTIHRSQGSQFATVTVMLPDVGSRLMTRELLYTAVTRARRDVTVVATPDAVRAAIARRVIRSSGIRDRLRRVDDMTLDG